MPVSRKTRFSKKNARKTKRSKKTKTRRSKNRKSIKHMKGGNEPDRKNIGKYVYQYDKTKNHNKGKYIGQIDITFENAQGKGYMVRKKNGTRCPIGIFNQNKIWMISDHPPNAVQMLEADDDECEDEEV